MKEIQTRPTLVDSRFAGFARVCRYVPNNTHRSLPITEKLTVSGLNRFFTAILLLTRCHRCA